MAALDINLYRDDLQERDRPVVRPTDISVDLHGKKVVLVDDVLYTGRTIRAALDALSDFGRPKEVQLAILLDRGHRELPIRPDYVGQNIPTAADEQVKVRLVESDGVDEVAITKRGPQSSMSASRAMETQELTPAPELAGLPPRRHVLDLDDFSPAEISAVLESTQGMAEVLGRDIKKVPTLRGRVVVTLFYEASTRTRVSFEEAGKVLSADVINVSASASSVEKGESLINTALTLQAMGVDIIVIRHPHSGAPNLLARHLDTVGRDKRRRRHPRPSDPGAVGPVHGAAEAGQVGRPESGHRRRRAPQPGRPFQHLGLRQDGRQGRPLRAPHVAAPGNAPGPK